MSDIKDFIIENGVLKKYVGDGGDVVIPEGVTSIGNYAFSRCTNLTNVTIPDGITSIGREAFGGCENLKEITLSDSVTCIGDSAFYGCTSLTSITLPDSVTNIGKSAFYWCQNLTSIVIPDSITHIGDAAFEACPGLADEDGFVIKRNVLYGYAGNALDVSIPDNVTAIDCGAFKYCMYVVSITIPDSVTSIGNSAFDDCRRLISITIPNSVTSIGDSAFNFCESLTSITIPDSVTNIGDFVFHGCSSLTSITIPDTVTSIGNYAFSNCKSLTSITIPDSVTNIGDFVFRGCSSLTSITIPDSVTNINNYAFSNCRNLKSITFSNNLKEIGEGAFENCVNLRGWNFNEEITTFEGTALEVVFNCFFSLEMKLFLLEKFLFDYLDIVINNTSVNKKVKTNKKKLFDLAVKEDNAELVEKLFNLYKKIPLDELNEYIDKATTAPTLKAYLLAYKARCYSVDNQEKHETEKLEKEFGIKERTLADWKKIYLFEVNDDTATITGYKGTDIDIVIPEKMGKYKVVAIGDSAFSTCALRIKEEQKAIREKIRNIVIPNSITSIGHDAFWGCKNLTEITIPDGITSIGREAFWACENLTEITIPDGITSIKKSTFSGCKSLIAITIPDSVTNIDDGAFAGCKQLKSVSIDFSKVKIGNNAFAYCDGLTNENGFFIKDGRLLCVRSDIKEYSIPDEVISLDDNTMTHSKTPVNLNPDFHKISYKMLAHYCQKASMVKLPSDLTTIRDAENHRGLCTYNVNLKEVQMPETITKIGSMAFKKCENLTEIHLREGITNIGEEAFAGSGLRKVTIPSTVKHIPLQAFAGCSNLMVVNISEGVKTIEVGAFERCTALTEIYIPASIESISDGALPANKNKTIYTPAGSYAEQYAKENKIKVKHEKEKIEENTMPFEYKISKDKTVKITAYVSDNPNLVIPAQIEGCKVIGFNKGIFKNNKVITSVVWPAEIPVIPSEIFFGCSSIDNVVLSEGITEISEKSFRNCLNLTSIYIPASVTSIHEKAFECAKNTVAGWEYWTCVETIHAPAGSYAETYAKENNIPFVAE